MKYVLEIIGDEWIGYMTCMSHGLKATFPYFMVNILNRSGKNGNLSDCNSISYFTEIAPRLHQHSTRLRQLARVQHSTVSIN